MKPKWRYPKNELPEDGSSHLVQFQNGDFTLCRFNIFENDGNTQHYFEDDFENRYHSTNDVKRYCDLCEIIFSIQ